MKKNILKIFIFLIFSGSIFFLFLFFSSAENKITFLNVGQGSATLIQTQDGKNILIDTGNEQVGLKSLTKKLGFFDRNLDIVFITHYDLDHIGLLPYLLKNYQISLIVDNGLKNLPPEQIEIYQEIQKLIKNQNIKYLSVRAGDNFFLTDYLNIKILYPYNFLNLAEMNSNSTSLVLKINFADQRILISGDLPQKMEKTLVEKYGDLLRSDILLAGHHGSKTSSAEKFLKQVKPKYFIISAGKNNSYGHPHQSVLDLAKKLNLKILQTAEVGNISF